MLIEPNHIYHIYNQGNNRQRIFFNPENYLYFLKKIKRHVLPYADLLAWCLMPNHFHLLVVAKADHSDRVTWRHPVTGEHPVAVSHPLNNSIAVMLRSYTRAINIEQKRTGSIFREGTKATLIGSLNNELIKYKNYCQKKIEKDQFKHDNELLICFHYIHNNPLKAGLVPMAVDYEFSSARDIAGLRAGTLINRKLIAELGLDL